MAKHRTTHDFLRELQAQDKTVSQWCREKGFSAALAYRVIKGQSLGRWGEVRRIAKAMGLPLPASQALRSRNAEA